MINEPLLNKGLLIVENSIYQDHIPSSHSNPSNRFRMFSEQLGKILQLLHQGFGLPQVKPWLVLSIIVVKPLIIVVTPIIIVVTPLIIVVTPLMIFLNRNQKRKRKTKLSNCSENFINFAIAKTIKKRSWDWKQL